MSRYINGIVRILADSGVKEHDRVLIHRKPDIELVSSIIAISRMGAIFSIIHPETRSNRLKYIINDLSPRAIIADDTAKEGYSEKSIPIINKIETKNTISDEFGRIIDIDPAMIIYTSGSTGYPKGVMLSHHNIDSVSDSIISIIGNTQDDVILNVLPLSFDYGLYQFFMSLKFGGVLIQEDDFRFPHRSLDRISKESVTGLPVVPAVVNIIRRIAQRRSFDFSSVRYITNTAQALSLRNIETLQRYFTNSKIFSMYGLTECKRVSCLPPEKINEKPNSVGRAIPNTEVFLIDEKGSRIDDPYVVGELVVRGSNVMMGYWQCFEDNRKILVDHGDYGEKVLLTGDLFKIDSDGDLYFVSRKDDIVKTAGEKVNPIEIERFLLTIEGVTETIVIPVEDEILGKALKAMIVCDDTLALDLIRDRCRNEFESYMVPKYFVKVDEIPKMKNNKIDRTRAKSLFA